MQDSGEHVEGASAVRRRSAQALDALEVTRPEMCKRKRKQVIGRGRIERDGLKEAVERFS
jgi:hypothetical protein